MIKVDFFDKINNSMILSNNSLTEQTVNILDVCPAVYGTFYQLICVSLIVEFRRIRKLVDYRHSISVSELGDNDQCGVC